VVTPVIDMYPNPDPAEPVLRGFTVGASYQYYPYASRRLEGFFFGAGLDLVSVSSETRTRQSLLSLSPFVNLGYNWIYSNGLSFGLSIGISLNGYWTKEESYTSSGWLPLPKGAVNLGYMF